MRSLLFFRELATKAMGVIKETKKSVLFSVFLGAVIVFIILSVAVFADFIAPYDHNMVNMEERLVPPCSYHLLGTDMLGRDILSRIIHGARISIFVGFLSAVTSASVGSALGILSGYEGGKIDALLDIPINSLYSFPSFLLALVITIVLQPTLINISIAIAVAWIPVYFRVVRSLVITLKTRTLIEQERALGAGHFYIAIHYILPACSKSIIVMMTLGVCRAIITISGLGFIGYGIPPPTPEWGTEMSLGRRYFLSGAWWPTLFPGLTIALFVFGLNLLGESLNTMLEPSLRVTYK